MTTIELIEQFFGVRFDSNGEGDSAEEGGLLLHFDGFVYWSLYLDARKHYLWIMADKEPQNSHPVFELYVFYGGATLDDDDPYAQQRILKIRPNNTEHEGRFLWFTRYGQGRISFATSFGDEPATD